MSNGAPGVVGPPKLLMAGGRVWPMYEKCRHENIVLLGSNGSSWGPHNLSPSETLCADCDVTFYWLRT